jgi:DNA mismatch endonuclease (patch repair protein)
MPDNMTRAQRSYTMSRIRSNQNASTELQFLALLRRARIVGWRRNSDLPGKPDFVFPNGRLAVFIDGCFWHGCPRCALKSKSNAAYWSPKISGNVVRDRRITKVLKNAGWDVMRIWEHTIKKRPAAAITRLKGRLTSKRY